MKRSFRLLSLLAATLLLLAACSSADETGGAATEAGDAAAGISEAAESLVTEPTLENASEAADAAQDAGEDLAAVAADNPQLTQLTQALEASGLTSVLEDAGPLTVFAPNDDAFASLDQADLAQLLTNPSQLGDILQYHVVEGAVPSSELEDGQKLTTLSGDELTVSVDGSTVSVNGAEVVQPDLQAGNGVIHVIDTVLQP